MTSLGNDFEFLYEYDAVRSEVAFQPALILSWSQLLEKLAGVGVTEIEPRWIHYRFIDGSDWKLMSWVELNLVQEHVKILNQLRFSQDHADRLDQALAEMVSGEKLDEKPCTNCGTSIEDCNKGIWNSSSACCHSCKLSATHGQ